MTILPFIVHPFPPSLPPPTDPADYRGTTRDEAIANPTMSGLNPSQLEACVTITIVNDSIVEGSEQFQVSMEFSDLLTNINVEGCPANVTILDSDKSKIFPH